MGRVMYISTTLVQLPICVYEFPSVSMNFHAERFFKISINESMPLKKVSSYNEFIQGKSLNRHKSVA